MFRLLFIALFSIFVASVTLPAWGAEIYKWVDENGKVHYGDRPPADAEVSEEVEIKNAPATGKQAPSAAQRLHRQQRLLDSFAAERAEKKQAAAKEKEQEKKHDRRCVVAKHNLNVMKQAGAHYDLNEAGEKVYATDAEREKSIRDYEKQINKYCK